MARVDQIGDLDRVTLTDDGATWEGSLPGDLVVDGLDGVWRCHTIFNCQRACPKDLDPTSAIAHLKREILKNRVFGKKYKT